MTRNTANIFISYHHKDEQLLRQLENHLALLQREGLISTWCDRQIPLGTERILEIDTRLEQATIILLLVTADFLASDYCYQHEMKRALERHEAGQAQVVPILLRPVFWREAPFAHLQILPRNAKAITSWSNRDEALAHVVDNIRRLVKGMPLLPMGGRVLGLELSTSNPIGRDDLLRMLKQKLTDHDVRSPIVVLHGLPGVGKTTIAAQLAYDNDIAACFPGGVLWASVGKDRTLDYILGDWASKLGLDLSSVTSPSQKIAHIQQELGNQPFLLIMDDLWMLDPALTPLLGMVAPGCASLVTTRYQDVVQELRNTVGNRVVSIEAEELYEKAAITLLMTLCQDKLTDRGILVPLAQAAGGLPLTLELMGSYINNHLPVELDALQIRQRLRRIEAHLRLPGDAGPRHLSLEQAIDLSVDDLPNRRTKRAFYALGVFAPKPATFSKEAMLRVTKADPEILQTLCDRNLLHKSFADRYTLHQALATYARSHLSDNDSAWKRHRLYYQQQFKEKIINRRGGINEQKEIDWRSLFYDLHQFRCIRLPRKSVAAFAIVINRLSSSRRWLRHLNNLPFHLTAPLSYILLTGLTLLRMSANVIGQKHIEALFAYYQGWIYAEAEIRGDASDYFERACQLWDTLENQPRLVQVLNNLGQNYYMQSEYLLAIKSYHRALDICRQLNDQRGLARTLTNIGSTLTMIDRENWALESLSTALSLYEKLKDRKPEDDLAEAHTQLITSMAYYGLGNREQTLYFLNQALQRYTSMDRTFDRARTLTSLGLAYLDLEPAVGQEQDQSSLNTAMEYFQKALKLQEKSRSGAWQGRTLSRIGQVYAKQGKTAQALDAYLRALSIHQDANYPAGVSATLGLISIMLRDAGEGIWEDVARESESIHPHIGLTVKQEPME